MNDDTDSTSLQLQKRFYHPLCTPAEIERVFNPQNAKDYLLALRANYIVDNMRIYRFFLRAWRAQGEEYSLDRNFDDVHYRDYLVMLAAEDRERLSSVTFGDVFTKEPTGEIFCSPFGRIVTISRSLRYFLEYSHLALKRLSVEIPLDVRFAALIIALRVMFEYETMDFEVDPRGKLSPRLLTELRQTIPSQLRFIAGHEFAHHLLNHLSDAQVHDGVMRSKAGILEQFAPARIYSTSQQQEFAADIAAIMNPRISDVERAKLLNSTLIFFAALELYQHARDVIAPRPQWKVATHPSARERHFHLLNQIETRYTKQIGDVSESIVKAVDGLKQPLSTYLSLQIESFETYGSIYLSEPNTEWRGPELVDRKDYY